MTQIGVCSGVVCILDKDSIQPNSFKSLSLTAANCPDNNWGQWIFGYDMISSQFFLPLSKKSIRKQYSYLWTSTACKAIALWW